MSRSIYKGGLRIKEQHLIILDVFRLLKKDELVQGSWNIYRTKIVAMMVMIIGMKFVFDVQLPSLLDIILIPIFAFLMTTLLIGYAHKLNQDCLRNPFSIFKYLIVLLLAIIVLSMSVYVY